MILGDIPCFQSVRYMSTSATPCYMVATNFEEIFETRSSWLNCALRDDEAVYWVSIGHYEAVAVGN